MTSCPSAVTINRRHDSQGTLRLFARRAENSIESICAVRAKAKLRTKANAHESVKYHGLMAGHVRLVRSSAFVPSGHVLLLPRSETFREPTIVPVAVALYDDLWHITHLRSTLRGVIYEYSSAAWSGQLSDGQCSWSPWKPVKTTLKWVFHITASVRSGGIETPIELNETSSSRKIR